VRVLARVKEDEKGGEVKKANGVAGCDFHFFFTVRVLTFTMAGGRRVAFRARPARWAGAHSQGFQVPRRPRSICPKTYPPSLRPTSCGSSLYCAYAGAVPSCRVRVAGQQSWRLFQVTQPRRRRPRLQHAALAPANSGQRAQGGTAACSAPARPCNGSFGRSVRTAIVWPAWMYERW
jgi:hypothetical protein